MKKLRYFVIFSIFSCMAAGLFGQNQSFFSNEICLGTGVPIYADSISSQRKDILASDDYKRIAAGLSYNAVLNISEPIKIAFGADLMTDFLWDGKQFYHTLDYAFCAGIKVFPGNQGLNLGIDYTIGNRADFLKEPVQTQEGISYSKSSNSKAWGNGFKLCIQYDFLNSSPGKVKPLLGVYYRCIPRGSNLTDHTLCIYGGIRL